jgi:hypothetical protein
VSRRGILDLNYSHELTVPRARCRDQLRDSLLPVYSVKGPLEYPARVTLNPLSPELVTGSGQGFWYCHGVLMMRGRIK